MDQDLDDPVNVSPREAGLSGNLDHGRPSQRRRVCSRDEEGNRAMVLSWLWKRGRKALPQMREVSGSLGAEETLPIDSIDVVRKDTDKVAPSSVFAKFGEEDLYMIWNADAQELRDPVFGPGVNGETIVCGESADALADRWMIPGAKVIVHVVIYRGAESESLE